MSTWLLVFKGYLMGTVVRGILRVAALPRGPLGSPCPQNVPRPSLFRLLVIEHEVWAPDLFRGNVDFFHAAIVVWVPFQIVIHPLLEMKTFHY